MQPIMYSVDWTTARVGHKEKKIQGNIQLKYIIQSESRYFIRIHRVTHLYWPE